MKSNLEDIDVQLHHTTKHDDGSPKAYLVSTDGDRKNAKWVPASLVELEHKGGTRHVLTGPQDVLEDKGLV